MKIYLFAPVDCEIKSVDKSTDKTFSEKMLGDGILIIPKNDKDSFKSPFEKAKVSQIFDTKHATWFSLQNINALVHCGLETVNLNGTPFDFKIKQGQDVTNETTIFDVDWSVIKNAKLSTETPIVFESSTNKKIKISILKSEAKQGEKIAEVELIDEVEATPNPVNSGDKKFVIKAFKNKYRKTAELIFANIGEGNYQNVYNCMTRFRANIIDKSKVNVDNLKKLEIVKGVQYNGTELQIIIGGEVVKIVDEFKKYETEPKGSTNADFEEIRKEKISVGRKILSTITGVMGPVIPATMAAGMFAAIFALLQISGGVDLHVTSPDGVVSEIRDISQIWNPQIDMFSALMFVLSKVILNGIGVILLISAVRYFKGNITIAIAVGLILSSRAFFGSPGTDYDIATFGDWVNANGKQGFLLFKIGATPIVVGGYEGSILPYFAAAALILFTDKWVKSWMPSVVDVVFRSLIVITITIVGTWFIFGPLMGLIEFGLVTALTEAGKIPGGIGIGIMALIWQPLVLTGSHSGIVMPIQTALATGESQGLMIGIVIAVFAQVGAVIAVAVVTKNYTLKQVAYGSILGGMFGVTEPIIYGVNLPKVKPFVLACLSAFPVGMLAGILGIDADVPGGLGVMAVFSYTDGVTEMLLVILMMVLAIAVSFVVNFFFYTERSNELKEIKKLSKLVTLSMIGKENKTAYKDQKEKINELLNKDYLTIKEMKDDFKKLEAYISAQTRFEANMVSVENKETQMRGKMYKKLTSLKDKFDRAKDQSTIKQEDIDKFNELNNKYESFTLESKKDTIKQKINDNNAKYGQFVTEFEIKRNDLINKIKEEISNGATKNNIELVENQIWNALYCVEVGFGMEDKKYAQLPKNVKIQA